MGKVNLLPDEIVSKIAAGEVIERPASCVKELVENSLDAGAETVSVALRNSGKTMIEVSDSGAGIPSDDLDKLFARHATSKLSTVEDLYNISSLGFRGEALYSIASIADVVLRSKTASQDSGWEVHVRGGKRSAKKPVSMNTGTSIIVNELFFNTPARRKFMKSDTTELNAVLNVFTPYTLYYPGKGFSIMNNDRMIMDLKPAASNRSRIAQALRVEENNIIEAFKNDTESGISIRIFLGDMNIQRPRKDMQFIFVNSRPVQDRTISFHINQIYRLIMPEGVNPLFAVFLDIPSGEIDVNTHPTKREIKIKDDKLITQMLRPLCEHTLMASGGTKKIVSGWMPETKTTAPVAAMNTAPADIPEVPRATDNTSSPAPVEKQYVIYRNDAMAEKTEIPPSPVTPLRGKLSSARYIGCFLRKYVLFESGTSILVIDQHAAQERITYERLLNQVRSKTIEVQHLLSPFILKLTYQEMLSWEGLKDRIESIGIATTLFDKESIAIHSHPAMLKTPEAAVRNILAEKDTLHYDLNDLARLACRSSLMAGDFSNEDIAEHLRKGLLKCADPFTCPHGRPTIMEIEEKFLNRQFLR